MLQKNASRAFDYKVIEQMVYNMLYEGYHTNGIYYNDAKQIFDREVNVCIHTFALCAQQFNEDVLDGIDVSTCNNNNSREMYDACYALADEMEAATYEYLHNHKNLGMIAKACDTSFVYQIAYSATETLLSIIAVSRQLCFRTQ